MKDKITIGIFVDTFFPMTDGVAMVVDNYARRLIKYANVIVFTPSYIGSDFDDLALPYKVVRCYSLKTYFWDYNLPIPKLDKKFKKILDSYKLDIVHINSPFTLGKEGVRYAKKHNIPCVATMHSQYKQDFMKAVKNEWIANILTHNVIKVFNKCDECFAVNSEVARIYYEEYHYKCLPKVLNNATEMELVKDT
ncbi:MAG: glycosyltransferase [Clostridium sp.]|nr:glycosyltransferase [Clostridium sp.]